MMHGINPFEKSYFRCGAVETFWVITRRMVVAVYRRFGTTHISLKMEQMCFTEMSVSDYKRNTNKDESFEINIIRRKTSGIAR